MGVRLGPVDAVRSLWRLVRGRPHVPPSLQDNALLDVLLRRRSVRAFSDRVISDNVFRAILEAGRLAPSTVNLQTWSFAIFTADSWRTTFGSRIPFRGQRAVLVMGDTHRARTTVNAFPASPLVEYTVAVMNASLAAMAMNIAAEALGVSSVMLSETGRSGLLDAAYLKEKLGLPEAVIPLMTIVFGYARSGNPPMPPKLPLDQICFSERYREADPEVMMDWLAQMVTGYKVAYPLSSFDTQLKIYQAKIGKAEADLEKMIFHERA